MGESSRHSGKQQERYNEKPIGKQKEKQQRNEE